MHNYKKLQIWQDAVDITTDVYDLTIKFPKEEIFGIISQIRRSAVSIASNIAEGAGRNTNGEFKQFLGIAVGSSYELTTQLIISEKLKYCTLENIESLLDRLDKNQKMIYNLIESLK